MSGELKIYPDCDHSFQYGGLRYTFTANPLPGSGAYGMRYYTWFYCRRCTESKLHEIGEIWNSYEPIRFDAIPLGKEYPEIGESATTCLGPQSANQLI